MESSFFYFPFRIEKKKQVIFSVLLGKKLIQRKIFRYTRNLPNLSFRYYFPLKYDK